MDHPHVQQINAMTLVMGSLIGLLQQKGLITQDETTQVFALSEQLLDDDATSGAKIIELIQHMANELSSHSRE